MVGLSTYGPVKLCNLYLADGISIAASFRSDVLFPERTIRSICQDQEHYFCARLFPDIGAPGLILRHQEAPGSVMDVYLDTSPG